MTTPPIVLIHGAATTWRVWDRLMPLLAGLNATAVERPCSGDLSIELAYLAPRVDGALVVGVGGGATLGLALASSTARFAGAILHEPAVGSLAPGLLAPMAEAFATGGVATFGERLYGSSWTRDMAPDDDDVVAKELSMFRGFEPAPAAEGQGSVVITVGAESPAARQSAANALTEHFGYPVQQLAASTHFVHWDNPAILADLLREKIADLTT